MLIQNFQDQARRILLLGCGGSGKSMLAKQLGKKLQLPVIHLDREYWKPGWVKTEREVWHQKVTELLRGDRWIMDGNYQGTLEQRLSAADTVIFLDYSKWACLSGIMKRRIQNHKRVRSDMGENCPERLSGEFVSWVFHFQKRNRPEILEHLMKQSDKQIVVLKTRREARQFVEKYAAQWGAVKR